MLARRASKTDAVAKWINLINAFLRVASALLVTHTRQQQRQARGIAWPPCLPQKAGATSCELASLTAPSAQSESWRPARNPRYSPRNHPRALASARKTHMRGEHTTAKTSPTLTQRPSWRHDTKTSARNNVLSHTKCQRRRGQSQTTAHGQATRLRDHTNNAETINSLSAGVATPSREPLRPNSSLDCLTRFLGSTFRSLFAIPRVVFSAIPHAAPSRLAEPGADFLALLFCHSRGLLR